MMCSAWMKSRLIVVLVILLTGMLSNSGVVIAQGGLKGDVDETPTAESDVEDGSWESPLSGVEVTWDEPWVLLSSTFTDESDRLGLVNEDGNRISVVVSEEGRGGPSEDVAVWTSEDFLESLYHGADTIEVPLVESGSETAAGATLTLISDGGMADSYAEYRESLPGLDYGLYVLTLAPLPDFPEVQESAQNGILIDGEPRFAVFSGADVDSALTEFDPVEFDEELAGLVDDTTYVSPRCAYEVTWPRDWTVDYVESSPVDERDYLELVGEQAAVDPLSWSIGVYGDYSTEPGAGEMEYELDRWTSQEWTGDVLGPLTGYEVLLDEIEDDTWGERLVAVDLEADGSTVFVWSGVAVDQPGCVRFVDVFMTVETAEETWAVATQELMINGEELASEFSWREIEDAIELYLE